jgi:hypothetical protein
MSTPGINTHNLVTSNEACNIIETLVKARKDLNQNTGAIIFRGCPGIGKSSIVRHVAEKLNIGFVDIRLAQLDRVDLCGLPSVENGTTKWNVPSFWPSDPDSKGILFFDEITSAPADIQAASYSIILDRCIPNTNYRIPDGWSIVAAGNLATDRAVVKPMSSALANRFMHFELEASAEDWGIWAVQHSIHPSVTGYIQYKPNNLFNMAGQNLEQGWPSPRSWEGVSKALENFGGNEALLQKVVYGLVGPAAGIEFMAFHKIAAQASNVIEMLLNPAAEIVIPKEADRRYALCSAVAYHLWNGKTEDEHKQRVTGFYRIINELTPDFATSLAKMCMNGNASVPRIKAMQYIMYAPEYAAFADKYKAAFADKTYSL